MVNFLIGGTSAAPPADWGNCTDLTFAAMAYIWGSDKYNYSYSFPGHVNGVQIAPDLRSEKGFSDKVGAGSAGSAPMWSPAGHTWVILHVFKGDSAIAIEQNVHGLSGDLNGQTRTYNFIYLKNPANYSTSPANCAYPPDNWKKAIEALMSRLWTGFFGNARCRYPEKFSKPGFQPKMRDFWVFL